MTESRAEGRIKAIVEKRLGLRWADFHDAMLPELTAKLRLRGVDLESARGATLSTDDVRELARDITVG